MRIKLIVLAAVLGCFAVLACVVLLLDAPSSHAQNQTAPDRIERLRPQISFGSSTRPAPAASIADEQFLRLDVDGDGVLNFAEMTDILQLEIDRWDVNRDRHIDLPEWRRYVEAVHPHLQRPVAEMPVRPPIVVEPVKQPRSPVPDSPRADQAPTTGASRPPFVDNVRRKVPLDPSGKYPRNLPAWFKEYDADADGQVALYEWQAKKDVLEEFKKYDLNDDGFITIEELIRSGQFIANTKAPQTLNGFPGDVGDFFYFEVTGGTRGTVWGTDIYTADSMLAATAVHAGVLQVGETGLIKVTILAGQDRYEGSNRHEITSQNFGMFPKSYRVDSTK